MFGALFALPVLLAAYPPMDDLPLHEASVGLWRHWGDPRFAPPTLYFLNLGHANQLFSVLALVLSYVVAIGWASKIVVAASIFALPLAAAHFADYVRAPRWSALVVVPIGLGWLFFWGLVQNILGIVALLALLPAIDRFATRPTARGALGMCGAMLLLHFAHQAMQLVACLALVVCAVGSSWRPRATMTRAIPVVFCVALFVAANRYAWHVSGARHTHVPLLVFQDQLHKITILPGVLFGGFEVYVRNLMFVLALGAVALLATGPRTEAAPSTTTWAGRLRGLRFHLIVATLVALYFAAPANVQSTTLVYHRFLPVAWAFLAVIAGAGRAARPVTKLVCCLVPVGSLLIAWPTFADSHRVYSELEPLLDRIEIGSSIVTLNLGPYYGGHRLWNPVDAQGHIVALRGGRCLDDYTPSPTSPVSQRADRQWLDPLLRLQLHPYELRPDWDLTRFRYLLVWTGSPGLGAAVALALDDEARLVAQSGTWYLFESKLEVVPIDAPDAPLPPHPGPTLLKKLEKVARTLNEPSREDAPPGEPKDEEPSP